MTQIEICNLVKKYNSGNVECTALDDIDLELDKGEFVAIVGPSGSGKSTLLNMITGIDKPTKGSVKINTKEITEMDEDKLASWRCKNMGVIFQFFQLFPTLTALENVILPMDFAKNGNGNRKDMALRNLKLVGLKDKSHNLPMELSGGEKQRVAIARALANDPDLIVGDEPTGNLDTHTADKMYKLLRALNKKGKTVIFVTHNMQLAERADRTIVIRDGKLEN